jgi:SAM-dependent methyltransferase
MPVPESVAALYGIAPDAYWPPDYFRTDPGYLGGTCSRARALLASVAEPRALDVGAGIGKGVLALRRAGFTAMGLEPSPTFRALALERMGLAAADMVLGTVEDAAFPDASFDFVNLGAVLEHVPSPGEVLARTARWLRPGGVLHAEVPSALWLLGRGLNLFYRATGQGCVTNTSPMHPPFHLYEFTRSSFAAAASRTGCALVSLEVEVADVMGPRLLRGPLGWLMARTGTGMQLLVWLRKD